MKLGTKHWRSGLVMVGAVVAFLGLTIAFAANPNPGVLPLQSHPYGKTYGEWSNAWWKWAFSIPASVNPLLDTTGVHCGEGQSGPVWFLAGTLGGGSVTRDKCIVPTGKALFFPIANTQQDNICPPASYTVAQLRQLATDTINAVDVNRLAAKVDNTPIQNLQNYRVGSNNPAYSVILPSDNLYSSGCGTSEGTYYPAVSDGYYLMLVPLPPGSHTIHFTASDFGINVTYILTVK